MIKTCVIGLGSNESSPNCILLAQTVLRSVFPNIRFSRLQQTVPIGCLSPRLFYNQVAICTTMLPLSEMQVFLKNIETAYGRRPEDKASGIVKLDLDLLCYDGCILKPDDWSRTYVRDGLKDFSI